MRSSLYKQIFLGFKCKIKWDFSWPSQLQSHLKTKICVLPFLPVALYKEHFPKEHIPRESGLLGKPLESTQPLAQSQVEPGPKASST